MPVPNDALVRPLHLLEIENWFLCTCGGAAGGERGTALTCEPAAARPSPEFDPTVTSEGVLRSWGVEKLRQLKSLIIFYFLKNKIFQLLEEEKKKLRHRVYLKLHSLQQRHNLLMALVLRHGYCGESASLDVLVRIDGEKRVDDLDMAVGRRYREWRGATVLRLVHSRLRRQERCDDLCMTVLR